MKRKYSKVLFVIILLIFSLSSSPILGNGTVLPKIENGENTPVIDGNITNTEWNTSVAFSSTLFDQNTTAQITTNSSHLFIGFNVSLTTFSPVNNTIPAYNHTVANYTLGYNNQTHDWFAVVIDNNLDKSISENSIGTSESPDDVIVIDQYNSTAYDGYADGNSSFIFKPDKSIHYNGSINESLTAGFGGEIVNLNINGTKLPGNNGTLDAYVARMNSSDGEGVVVSYEIIKPLNGSDVAGFDFDLSLSNILQFKIFGWRNALPNDTLTSATFVDQTEWFSLRINETGTGLSIKSSTNTSINIVSGYFGEDKLDALETTLELYGFDISVSDSSITNTSLEEFDLNIIFFGSEETISNSDIDRLTSYIRTGGNALVLLSDQSATASRNLVDKFEMDYLSNNALLQGNFGSTSLLNLSSQLFNPQLPLSSAPSIVTDRIIDTIQLRSSVLNVTNLLNETNTYLLGQQFYLYNLWDSPDGIIYDESGDGFINETESFSEELSLGIAFDFQKLARLSIIPTTSLFSDGGLTNANNLHFLLRLIPWNARIQNILELTNLDSDTHTIRSGENVTVTVNITDGLGNELTDTPDITLWVEIAGNTVQSTQLTQLSGSTYGTSFEINQHGFISLNVLGFLGGYGFAETDSEDLYVKKRVISFNDLAELEPLIIVLFITSLALLVLVIQRMKFE